MKGIVVYPPPTEYRTTGDSSSVQASMKYGVPVVWKETAPLLRSPGLYMKTQISPSDVSRHFVYHVELDKIFVRGSMFAEATAFPTAYSGTWCTLLSLSMLCS